MNPEDAAGCSTSTAAGLHTHTSWCSEDAPDSRKVNSTWPSGFLKQAVAQLTRPAILLCHSWRDVMKYPGFVLGNNLQIFASTSPLPTDRTGGDQDGDNAWQFPLPKNKYALDSKRQCLYLRYKYYPPSLIFIVKLKLTEWKRSIVDTAQPR